jgi:hypothetical protein
MRRFPTTLPYWYQVITLDASNSVPSAVAGPREGSR